MRKLLTFICALLCTACVKDKIIENNYKFEKRNDSEFKICVNRPRVIIEEQSPTFRMGDCGQQVLDTEGIYKESDNICDIIAPKVVDYAYCISDQLAFKTDNGVTGCYDRINKEYIPLNYCLPETNVSVSQNTSTHVLQKMVIY
jgi:hypothetical protein